MSEDGLHEVLERSVARTNDHAEALSHLTRPTTPEEWAAWYPVMNPIQREEWAIHEELQRALDIYLADHPRIVEAIKMWHDLGYCTAHSEGQECCIDELIKKPESSTR